MVKNNDMNLLYCGNDGAFDGILISLLSITKYCSEKLNVYIFTMDLEQENKKWKSISNEQINTLNKVVKAKNELSKILLIDVKDLYMKYLHDGKNKNSNYTPYAQLRLLADKVDAMPNKILYLDTDTVARADISNLYKLNIEDYELAGVKDYYGKIFINFNYINTGVLLLNLDLIRKNDLFNKSINMIMNKKMLLPDQSAINKYCKRKLILERKFNEQKKLKDNTVIRHFTKTIIWVPFFHTRNIKPWNIDYMHKYKIHWLDETLNDYLNLKNTTEN